MREPLDGGEPVWRVLDDAPRADQPRMRRAGEQLGQAACEVPQEWCVRMLRRGHVRYVDPLVRSAAVDEIAPEGLPPVETVARHPAHVHERDRLGGNHL